MYVKRKSLILLIPKQSLSRDLNVIQSRLLTPISNGRTYNSMIVRKRLEQDPCV